MKNNEKICFTSFVFGGYQVYIPYYIYFILKEYPLHYVKIFIEDKLDSKVIQALEKLKEHNYTNFEIVKADFKDYTIFDNYKIKGGGQKTLFRWLFNEKHFKEFDYVYYGDIDVLIMHENISLLEYHKQIIDTYKIPFSNKVRKDDDGNIVNRLSGLHFIETKPYFNKISPIINSTLNDSNFRSEIMKKVDRDENLLFEINKKAFDFDDTQFTTIITPLHGLHLGIARHLDMLTEETLKANSTLELSELKKILPNFYKDVVFKSLQNIIFIKELYRINELLDIKNSLKFKWIYFKYTLLYKKNKIKKIIKKGINV